MKLSLTLLAAFAGVVVADMHATCACLNSGSYNWRITDAACGAYGHGASYDHPSGRCVSSPGNELDGDTWQSACQTIASQGFACIDNKGTCYAEADTVKGDC